MDDEQLMANYQNGSESAFHELYRRHSGRVFGFIKSRIKDAGHAQDVLQEVFIKLHRTKSKYDPQLPFLGWMFTIANSVLIDHVRKQSRQKEDLGHDIEDAEASENFQHEGSNFKLADLLRDLPENQKKAVELRYIDEKTFDEIAAQLNTSTVNVRQLISRAIKKLTQAKRSGA